MKVFNEETLKNPQELVVVFTIKEARTLIDMMESAVETNKRKTTWKKIKKDFVDKAAVY